MTAGSSSITNSIYQPTLGQATQHIYGGLAGAGHVLHASSDHSLHAWTNWTSPEQWRDFGAPGMTRVYVALVDGLLGKTNFASLLQFYMDSTVRVAGVGKGSRAGMLARAGRNVFLFSGNPAVLATMPGFSWAGEATNRAYKAYIDGHNAPVIAAEQKRMQLMADQIALKQRYYEIEREQRHWNLSTTGVGTSLSPFTATCTSTMDQITSDCYTTTATDLDAARNTLGLAHEKMVQIGAQMVGAAKTEEERAGIIGKLKAMLTK